MVRTNFSQSKVMQRSLPNYLFNVLLKLLIKKTAYRYKQKENKIKLSLFKDILIVYVTVHKELTDSIATEKTVARS